MLTRFATILGCSHDRADRSLAASRLGRRREHVGGKLVRLPGRLAQGLHEPGGDLAGLVPLRQQTLAAEELLHASPLVELTLQEGPLLVLEERLELGLGDLRRLVQHHVIIVLAVSLWAAGSR